MQEPTKDAGAECSSNRPGESVSDLIPTTICVNIDPVDTSVTQSVDSTVILVSSPVSSTSVSTPAVFTLHSENSSIYEPQTVTSSGILEAAALLSGINEDFVKGGFATTGVPEGEESVCGEEYQIRIGLLKQDLYLSDTDSDDEASDDEIKLSKDLQIRNISTDYEPDSESDGGLSDDEDSSKRVGDIELNNNQIKSKGYESESDSDGGLSDDEDSSSGDSTSSDSDSTSSSSSSDGSSTDTDDSSTDDNNTSDDCSDSTDDSDDEECVSDVSRVPRKPLHKASDVLATRSVSFVVDDTTGLSFGEMAREVRKRKRDDDIVGISAKKRKLDNPVPSTSHGITKRRKRRASNSFDRDKFPPPKPKKKKLSFLKQSTFYSCPNTCPCKTCGRGSRIPAKERTFKVTEPLYKKFLKSQVMDPGNLSQYRCCDKYCCFRWFRYRIPSYTVLDDYWPSDHNVYHFSWGQWKDGEGYVY